MDRLDAIKIFVRVVESGRCGLAHRRGHLCERRPQIKQLQENNTMSAYLVFTREKTLDEAELKIYWDKIRPTFAGHQVKVLVNYGRLEVLEGDPVEGVVIAEFPSLEAAKAWYESPAYQAIRHHRLKGAIYSGLIVQGV
jgi:uncharacterized protein (DUF1330 family)